MSTSTRYPAFQHRNFRLLFSGQAVSLVGTQMQNATVLWHVSLLAGEHKAAALGAVGLVRVVPILLCALLGGVLADAFDRRRTMLVTQAAMALFASLLALLAWTDRGGLFAVYALTALTAAASAFDGPARTSLVPNLVAREHLSNAVSLNTMLFQLCSVIGPAAAGVSLVFLDVAWVYAINAVSFVPVLWALLSMRDVPARAANARSPVSLRAAVEGLQFVFRTPLIRATMLLDFIACFCCSATALLPIFAQDVLQIGPAGYGWLCAAPAIGAVLTSIFLVRHERSIVRRGPVLLGTIAVYGVATIAFGLSTNFALTLFCLAVVGAADTVNMVLRNVIRQLHTPDAMRGRMVGTNLVFSQGGPQLGEFQVGLVAQAFGPVVAVVTGGLACLLATGWITSACPLLRRHRGTDPDIAPLPGAAVAASSAVRVGLGLGAGAPPARVAMRASPDAASNG